MIRGPPRTTELDHLGVVGGRAGVGIAEREQITQQVGIRSASRR
jgi:hypothetical protein